MIRSNFIKRSFAALTALTLAVLMAISVSAQSGTTSINGAVTDQVGAAVPGATVKLTNPDTGFSRTVTTNSDGVYAFSSILPGTYTIEVEAAKFKKVIKREVKASVDSTIAVNISLEPGEVSAVVDVTGGDIESVINTQDATVGNNFVAQQIQQLPTDSRNIPDLLSLQPGVTKEGYVSGGRSDQANITLDGIDVNDQQTGAAFSSILRITAESIEEFRITTTNPNANQGRSSGAQISLITRGGTNKWRGALFEFHRPELGSANNFFNNAAGRYTSADFAVQNGTAVAGDERVPRPNLKRNIFGGAIGGPILKDKLFFFYSYEAYRERQSISVVRTVPTASLGRGELKFIGSTGALVTLTRAQLDAIFPVVLMNPASIAVLADAARKYPVNDNSVGDELNTGGYRFNAPAPVDLNTHIARFDWNISENQSLAFRANYQQDSSLQARYLPDTISPEFWSHPTGFGASHNWTINNHKVNNFRYGFTRQAFTSGGDSTENGITFRFVFQPKAFSNALSRITELQNFTDDFTWIAGQHTFQFGGNVRLISNKRESLASAYDFATANPSFYESSGRVLDRPITAAGFTVPASSRTSVQNAVSALIGRFSQYNGNFNYDISGNILPTGTSIVRNFATEEYDSYFQDIWKPFRNLTLTMGIRYALSRPVYEKDGLQVVPNQRLGDYFERRAASAAAGTAFNELIQFELGGPKNNAPGFYSMDWNNWQPRVAAAWSPNFKNKILKAIFGGENEATFRGGFAMTNDYFGQQLAVTFDGLTTLGFTTSDSIAANTYNVTTNPAPRFTNFGQSIRTLPNISAPNRFLTPADEDQRIESSLDQTLVSPQHYTWSFTYGRQLPKGMYVEATYTGRKAKNLLATRDIMALNNLVDRVSGMDWYTAAGRLHDLRAANTPIENVAPIPYFERLFPGLGGAYTGEAFTSTQEVYALVARDWFDILDWTYVQLLIDDDPNGTNLWRNHFFHPQYAAFSAFSTVAKSDYHGGSLSFRQRLGNTLSYDVNYTFSKSFDNASGLQTAGTYGSAFILNPLRPDDNYSLSDFDVRHVVNANFILEMPFGKGRQFFSNMNSVADAFLGGWQLSGIFRWNTGLPTQTPFDSAQWATNWNVQSNGVRVRPVNGTVVRSTGNIFSDPIGAYQSFRNARPGETGDRNVLRDPGYSAMDMGLSKSFNMPWEGHKLQFRWEVFNITNTQYFQTTNVTRGSLGLGQDPEITEPSSEFGKIFTDIQGQPRRMQFGLRYSF
ncbi:MAG: carboxypeptidase regulatory-like domain-containing protein [Acidobacteria bacterium]|nr:carboxypeptidase regulatory-like domain-containing protein [Acidobacteriota bacterium]